MCAYRIHPSPGMKMHSPSCAEILLTEHQWECAFLLAQIFMGDKLGTILSSHTQSTETWLKQQIKMTEDCPKKKKQLNFFIVSK